MSNQSSGQVSSAQKKQAMKNMVSKYGSLAALFLMIVVMTAIKPRFINPTNLRNILRLASINGLLAIGMTFVCLTGGIDLSVGAVMGCAGMYSAYFAQEVMNLPWFVGVAVGLAMGLAIGLFNGICVAYLKVPAFVGTLGSMSIAKGLTFILTNAKPIPKLSASFKYLGGGMIGGFLRLVVGGLAGLAVAFGLCALLRVPEMRVVKNLLDKILARFRR